MAVADFTTVVNQVIRMLNAAGFTNIISTATTATSGTVTGPSGTWVSTDVGKLIAIYGAGTGGIVYQGTITAVGGSGSITVSPVVPTTTASQACSFGGQMNDDRRNLMEIVEAIYEGDERTMRVGLATPNWFALADLLTLSASVTTNTRLPAHVGQIFQVYVKTASADTDYVIGIKTDPYTVRRYKNAAAATIYGDVADTTANSLLAKYFAVDENNVLTFTGFDAKVYALNYARGAALQSPQICTDMVCNAAWDCLFAKEGDDTATAGYFKGKAGDNVAETRALA